MAKYEIGDVTVDTDKATATWEEALDFHGIHGFISRATLDGWTHERMYLSPEGQYYLVRWSDWKGVRPTAEFVSRPDAAKWLLFMGHKLPKDLMEFKRVRLPRP